MSVVAITIEGVDQPLETERAWEIGELVKQLVLVLDEALPENIFATYEVREP